MVNVNMLKDAIKNSTHTIDSLSEVIGIDKSTFYRKLERNGATFTVEQANVIKVELGLSALTAQQIFFAADNPA